MSNTNASSNAGGIGCTGMMFLIFMTLKLVHVIAWSWWWITAPLWAPVTCLLLFYAFCYGMAKLAGQ